MIEHIERIGSKLQGITIAPFHELLQIDVPVLIVGSSQHVVLRVAVCGVCGNPSCVSSCEYGLAVLPTSDRVIARWRGEGCSVEPVGLAAVSWIEWDTRNEIGASTHQR